MTWKKSRNEKKMPQNTDNNNKTDETGTPGLATGSSYLLIEPPDPPDQNDTRSVEIVRYGGEMNSEAQVFDGNVTTTTTAMTIYNKEKGDEYQEERQAKRKANYKEDEVDEELGAIKGALNNAGGEFNTLRRRFDMCENTIQKMIEEIKALKEDMNNQAKENTELKKENAEIKKENRRLVERVSELEKNDSKREGMIDFLTLKANETDRKFKALEHAKQDRQSWAQVATLAKKVDTIDKNQKILAASEKQHNKAILAGMDHTKSVQKQLNSVKKTVNESNYPSAPVTPKAFAKAPCVTLHPSDRVEAMKLENRTEREVKKNIDKEISPSVVVGVNFTARGNLTLHIKDLNDETIEKLKPFGTPIDNETWHKVVLDGVQKSDLIENGELVDAEELKAEIENRNNIELACPPHAIKTEALKSHEKSHFSLVVAVKNERHGKELLRRGIFLINQHCRARKWLPSKPRTTLARPNELIKPTDAMEVDSTENSQSNANNDQ